MRKNKILQPLNITVLCNVFVCVCVCYCFTGNVSPMKSQQQQVTKTRERSPLPATFAHGLHSNRETECLTTDKQLTHLFFSRRDYDRGEQQRLPCGVLTPGAHVRSGDLTSYNTADSLTQQSRVVMALRHPLLLPASVATIHGSLRP